MTVGVENYGLKVANWGQISVEKLCLTGGRVKHLCIKKPSRLVDAT
jgi:hypothetical protein